MPVQNYKISDSGNVLVGTDAINALQRFSANEMPRFSSSFLLVDSNTRKLCLPLLQSRVALPEQLNFLEIEPGESDKTVATCASVWKEMANKGADRQSLLICLGGGVVCDLGGFVASTYQRGMQFIYLPTSLLAQVDASIGGKTGINLDGLKNYIGLFSNPWGVFILPEFLHTLPAEQLLSGFAEVVKHALIESKEDFTRLKKDFTDPWNIIQYSQWENVIKRSVEIKSGVVESDPTEKGLRKVLNFGHTIGHALETFSLLHDQQPLLHGIAIAMGMIAELELSVQLCGLPPPVAEEISHYLLTVFPAYLFGKQDIDELIALMQQDKKNRRKEIRITLLKDIGQPVVDCVCIPELLKTALNSYLTLVKIQARQ